VADAERARGEPAEALAATQERHAAHERRWLNELDAERGQVKRLQARLDELQAAQQQQAEQSRQALAQAAERQRGAESEAAERLRAAQAEVLAARGEAQAQLSRQLADVAVAQEALQASRRREQDLTQRLAASDAQQADLLGQLRTRDGQLLELTRHLIAARVAVRPTPGGTK
jgi:chromosome segregation ATPase